MATGMPPGMLIKIARRPAANDDAANDARVSSGILICHELYVNHLNCIAHHWGGLHHETKWAATNFSFHIVTVNIFSYC